MFGKNVNLSLLFCLIQDGKVVCQQVSCTPVSCINPSFIDGKCCPVCSSEWDSVTNMCLESLKLTYLKSLFCIFLCLFMKTIKMGGLRGPSGRTAQQPVDVEGSNVAVPAIASCLLALAPRSKLAAARWRSVTARVGNPSACLLCQTFVFPLLLVVRKTQPCLKMLYFTL